MVTKTEIGNTAEKRAARWWEGRGWKILARNYRGVGFEIDLIVQKDRTIAFVEVKYRPRLRRDTWQLAEFLTPRKRKALQRGAEHFITHRPPDADHYRFALWLLCAQGVIVTELELN